MTNIVKIPLTLHAKRYHIGQEIDDKFLSDKHKEALTNGGFIATKEVETLAHIPSNTLSNTDEEEDDNTE